MKKTYLLYAFIFILIGAITWGIHLSKDSNKPFPLYEKPQPMEGDLSLQIPLIETTEGRRHFSQEFLKIKNRHKLRPLYEKYIDQIGANGIVKVVHQVSPKCHGEGHDLGKVIFSKLKDIGSSLKTCQNACYAGCMHGVFMEFFQIEEEGDNHAKDKALLNKHLIVKQIREKISTICLDKSVLNMYRKGDCSHAVGHALMFVLDYDIPASMEHCKLFEADAMDYYCATGAYMEYVSSHGMDQKEGETLFYPCDTEDFPAACFRYKLSQVFRNHFAKGGGFLDIVEKCTELKGRYRLGCFHGVGNAHMGNIAEGNVPITYVCGFGNKDEQFMCIEGVAERMGKYHLEKGRLRCKDLKGWRQEVCTAALERKLYDLDKSFKFYF